MCVAGVCEVDETLDTSDDTSETGDDTSETGDDTLDTGDETSDTGDDTDECTPGAGKVCVDDAVMSVDSCGAVEDVVILTCSEDAYCEAVECAGPVYAGTWTVTADPKEAQFADGSTATFYPSSFTFEVDGDDVIVTDMATTPPTLYEGSLQGKDLWASAKYDVEQTQSTLEYDSVLEFVFEAGEGLGPPPRRFVGTLKDKVLKIPKLGPNEDLGTLTWQITGTR